MNSADEITLKDVLLKLREHVVELKNAWLVILLASLIVGAVFYLKQLFIPQSYRAECTFMLNDQEGGAQVGLTSILGQFGLGGRGEFKLEKIADLSKTRAMTSRLMFGKVEIDGNTDWMANHFIAEKEAHGKWTSNMFWEAPSSLEGFRFTHDSLDIFSRLENKALINLHRKFKEDLTTDIDEITGILSFSLTGTHEDLTYEMLDRLFDNVSAYYTGKSVEKQQATYSALAEKCDSLERELQQKEYALANIRDSYRGQWLNREKVPQEKLQRDIRMLTLMYGEALKNKELAAFSLDNMTPFVQAIDRPILPLRGTKPAWWMEVLKGLILGAAVGICWIVGRKIFADAMAE